MAVHDFPITFSPINKHFSVFPERIPLVDQNFCASIWDLLIDCNRHWKLRDPSCGFYTYGTPSYMDAVNSLTYYIYQSAQVNCFLGPIFDILRPVLVRLLSHQCDVSEQYILPLPFASFPGFHIFAPAFSPDHNMKSSFHHDLQHQLILPLIDNVLRFEASNQIELLSFTLPIKLPGSGAGLCFCEESVGVHRLAYAVGEIVLHGGQNSHKIDDGYSCNVGDVRATLQGHAIKTVSGKLFYYW